MTLSKVCVDIRLGGLGDIWMRLVALYVTAGLHRQLDICVVIPHKLLNAASCAFPDRLRLITEDEVSAITYTVRGLRDILPQAILGRKFASPYGRVVIRDWGSFSIKDRVNSLALTILDRIGVVLSPPWDSLDKYQGYSEVRMLPQFRSLSIDAFASSLCSDSLRLFSRLQLAPVSGNFSIPSSYAGDILVFPSGTGHQFMPIDWAARYLSGARYAFYHRDPELSQWKSAGLKTVVFYEEPGDMLALANSFKVTLTTDSFPSHFLQFSASNLVVLLAELPRERVVSPSYSGDVVEAVAPCHPCPHLERYGFTQCKAGHETCLNWHSPAYSASIFEAIQRFIPEFNRR